MDISVGARPIAKPITRAGRYNLRKIIEPMKLGAGSPRMSCVIPKRPNGFRRNVAGAWEAVRQAGIPWGWGPGPYSMTALWSILAGVPGLRSNSTSGMAAKDRIIISLKSSM